jgi:hypothetical protein
MPRREPQQEFNPKADFVVRKPFKAGGRPLQRGERFNPNRDALSMRRVRQLFDLRYIAQYAAEKSQPSPKPEPTPQVEPTVESEEPESSLDDLTKAELVERAKAEGISYAAQKNKSELVELLSQ